MNEKTRLDIVEAKKNVEYSIKRRKELLKEIYILAEELKESEEVLRLKKLGKEYLDEKIAYDKYVKIEEKRIDRMMEKCTHPLLCRISYVKHGSNNRVIKTDFEHAEYLEFKCLECGKRVFSMDKSEGENFEEYIFTPVSLLHLGIPYVKRPSIDIPEGMSFNKIQEYYKEEMYKQSETETIKKVLKKYKNE